MAVSKPQYPDGSFVVIHGEQEEVVADGELANLVDDVGVLLRFRRAAGRRLERIDGIPYALEPTLRVFRCVAGDGDIARLPVIAAKAASVSSTAYLFIDRVLGRVDLQFSSARALRDVFDRSRCHPCCGRSSPGFPATQPYRLVRRTPPGSGRSLRSCRS